MRLSRELRLVSGRVLEYYYAVELAVRHHSAARSRRWSCLKLLQAWLEGHAGAPCVPPEPSASDLRSRPFLKPHLGVVTAVQVVNAARRAQRIADVSILECFGEG